MNKNEHRFFQSGGEFLAYAVSYIEKLYRSTDGLNFYPLQNRGYSGNDLEHDLSFSNPFDGDKEGKFHFNRGVITMSDGKVFREINLRKEDVRFHPFLLLRKPEYLFRTKHGQYIYVSADKLEYSYESFKLFYGVAGAMKQIPVTDVVRYRDGGTTYVKMADGDLYSPTPFNKKEKATWLGQEVEKLDPKDFNITEVGDTATVSVKEPVVQS